VEYGKFPRIFWCLMCGGSNIQINLGKNLARLLQGRTTCSINFISTIIVRHLKGSNGGIHIEKSLKE